MAIDDNRNRRKSSLAEDEEEEADERRKSMAYSPPSDPSESSRRKSTLSMTELGCLSDTCFGSPSVLASSSAQTLTSMQTSCASSRSGGSPRNLIAEVAVAEPRECEAKIVSSDQKEPSARSPDAEMLELSFDMLFD